MRSTMDFGSRSCCIGRATVLPLLALLALLALSSLSETATAMDVMTLPVPPIINNSDLCLTPDGLNTLAIENYYQAPGGNNKSLGATVDSSLAFMAGASLVQRLLSMPNSSTGAIAFNTFVHQTQRPDHSFPGLDQNTLVSLAVVDVSGTKSATLTVPAAPGMFYAVALSDLYLDALGSFTSAQTTGATLISNKTSFSIGGPGALSPTDFVSPTKVVMVQLFITYASLDDLPRAVSMQRQFKLTGSSGAGGGLRQTLQAAKATLLEHGFQSGSYTSLRPSAAASSGYLSALSSLFHMVPPPATSAIWSLLGGLKRAGLNLMDGRAVSLSGSSGQDVLHGLALAVGCIRAVSINMTDSDGPWKRDNSSLPPLVKRAVYARSELSLGQSAFASSVFGGPQTYYAYHSYNGSNVQAINALSTYVLDMAGAAGQVSAWTVSVFTQGLRAQFKLPSTAGTFGAGGALDPHAPTAVWLASAQPPANVSVGAPWLALSGGAVVVLRIYPLAFEGFFKNTAGTTRRHLSQSSSSTNSLDVCINFDTSTVNCLPPAPRPPPSGVSPVGSQMALGLGYNILLGWPVLGGPGAAEYSYDQGMTGRQIFASSGLIYTKMPTSACHDTMTAATYQTSSDYNTNIDGEVDVKSKFLGVSFSASAQYQGSQSFQTSNQFAVSISHLACTIQAYALTEPNPLDPGAGYMPLSSDFQESTNNLLSIYVAATNPTALTEFNYALTDWLNLFGTSYISVAGYGGIAYMTNFVTGQQYSQAKSTDLGLSANAEFFGALSTSASGSSQTSSTSSSSSTVSASFAAWSPASPAPTQTTDSTGNVVFNAQAWSNALLTASPNLISYQTEPLTTLFAFTSYWPGFTSTQLQALAQTVNNAISTCQDAGTSLVNYNCVSLSNQCPSFSTSSSASSAGCINCGSSSTDNPPGPGCNALYTSSCTPTTCNCAPGSPGTEYSNPAICDGPYTCGAATSARTACVPGNTASCTFSTCTCNPGWTGADCSQVYYGTCSGYFHPAQNCYYNQPTYCTYNYPRMSNPSGAGHTVYCTCCTDGSLTNCGINSVQGDWINSDNEQAGACSSCSVNDKCM